MSRHGFNFLLIFVILFCFILIFLENLNIHGNVVENSFKTDVTVMKSLAVSFSSELQGGIIFEDVHILPSENVNATKDYSGENNSTEYYVYLSSDGNSNANFCIKAENDLFNSGGDFIGVRNESFSFSNFSNLSFPDLGNETSLTLNYSPFASSVFPGETEYLRFWLDVPLGQAPGVYNNTIFLKVVLDDESC